MEVTHYRKSVLIPQHELKQWQKVFSLFGTKSEFARLSGRSALGLDKILKKGKGTEEFVKAIRGYVESQRA